MGFDVKLWAYESPYRIIGSAGSLAGDADRLFLNAETDNLPVGSGFVAATAIPASAVAEPDRPVATIVHEAYDRIDFDFETATRARTLATEVLKGHAAATTKKASSDKKDIRNRAFTYLDEAVDEIRAAGLFAIRRDADSSRLSLFRSVYAIRRDRRHRAAASASASVSAPVSAPATASAPASAPAKDFNAKAPRNKDARKEISSLCVSAPLRQVHVPQRHTQTSASHSPFCRSPMIASPAEASAARAKS